MGLPLGFNSQKSLALNAEKYFTKQISSFPVHITEVKSIIHNCQLDFPRNHYTLHS